MNSKNTLNLQALRDCLSSVPAKDLEFAASLVKQYDRKGVLSERQWYWVGVLCGATPSQKVEQVSVSVGSFSKVMDLFAKAKQSVKFPKISLQVGAQELRLTLSGPTARYPGSVNVTDGKPFGEGTWFGRVLADGEWQVNMRAQPEALNAVEDFLLEFAQQPAKVAKEYGRLTGRCCFCARPLSDERSTSAGFGETCSKTFGLHQEWLSAQPVLETA